MSVCANFLRLNLWEIVRLDFKLLHGVARLCLCEVACHCALAPLKCLSLRLRAAAPRFARLLSASMLSAVHSLATLARALLYLYIS